MAGGYRGPDRAYSLVLPPADGPTSAPALGRAPVISWCRPARRRRAPRVVANLAAVYAEAGQRVIVVSTGDLDRR